MVWAVLAASSEDSDPAGALAAFVVIVGLWALFWGGIGAAIASGKGRPWAGFWWSFFLTWIGWIIAACLSPSPEAEARRNVEVRQFERRMAGAAQGLPPAGWYPDPSGNGLHRFWDGMEWTERTTRGDARA